MVKIKARLKTAYAFFLASLLLFFLAVILDVFTWAWEGKVVDMVQAAFSGPFQLSLVFRYGVTIFLTLVGVSVIFWAISKFSEKTWTKIATVLAIDHLFDSQSDEKSEKVPK